MGRIRIIRQGKTQKKSFFFSTKKTSTKWSLQARSWISRSTKILSRFIRKARIHVTRPTQRTAQEATVTEEDRDETQKCLTKHLTRCSLTGATADANATDSPPLDAGTDDFERLTISRASSKRQRRNAKRCEKKTSS